MNHGDAIILELPDYAGRAHFGVVDFGAKKADDREVCKDYLQALVDFRKGDDAALDFSIEFACVTHPHDDHFGGLSRFMEVFSDRIKMFWDCGFRTNSLMYNRIINEIAEKDDITFVRVSSGTEYEFGPVRIYIIAPSIDLRNRFDTYGIGKNDSSIVIRVQYRQSSIILGADAEFASWGKISEEYPRREKISFFKDSLGLAERDEMTNHLKCDLLKVAHHGSKHGSSLEYLEILNPNRIVYTAGRENWYEKNASNWKGMFPHHLTKSIFTELGPGITIHNTGEEGNIIYTYHGRFGPLKDMPGFIPERPGEPGFLQSLEKAW